jgi:hypothetical protein
VSAEDNSPERAKTRLDEIRSEADELRGMISSTYREAYSLVQKAIAKAQKAREENRKLAELRAEATYLRLSEGLEAEDLERAEIVSGDLRQLWKDYQVALKPVGLPRDWLEKIKKVEKRPRNPVLSTEERLELERRLKDNVCPICISFALDGTCTLQAFETCPIDAFLDRLVNMIEEMGHRPWMEHYFERMYRDICPGCSGRIEEDYCPPRESGECALFSYLPTVVRTVEEFMKDKREAEAS